MIIIIEIYKLGFLRQSLNVLHDVILRLILVRIFQAPSGISLIQLSTSDCSISALSTFSPIKANKKHFKFFLLLFQSYAVMIFERAIKTKPILNSRKTKITPNNNNKKIVLIISFNAWLFKSFEFHRR